VQERDERPEGWCGGWIGGIFWNGAGLIDDERGLGITVSRI
jgi:hypothetical protein